LASILSVALLNCVSISLGQAGIVKIILAHSNADAIAKQILHIDIGRRKPFGII